MIRIGALGAKGKLHDWDEYVTVQAAAPAFAAFDQWVAENMDAALARPGWDVSYRAGRVHAFVHSVGGTGQFLGGALAPSNDRAGRNYPLFVASELEPDGDAFALLESLPLALERLWDDSSRVVSLAIVDGSVASLGALLERTSLLPAPDLPGAISNWREWTEGMELFELAELLIGGVDIGFLAGALRAVLAAVEPHRGALPLRTRLSLKLPLGRAGGAAVCFWLGIAQRALGWERVLPSFFWTHDGDAGSLLLHVGAPPRTSLAQLWMPEPAEDVVDLFESSAAHAGARVAPALESVLTTEGATVADLFAAL
jgi:type VI secretion system ImpM family protein